MESEPLWEYIRERERIRLQREAGVPFPWTTDLILNTYKFTNVRRKHDKTTKWFLEVLKKNLTRPNGEVLYNCGVFRYHGTMEWFARCGWQTRFEREYMVELAHQMIGAGEKVYTGAYIITNGGKSGFKESVVCDFLEDLWNKKDDITWAIEESLTWQAGYEILAQCEGFGGSGFMAKEVLQDYLLWRQALQDSRAAMGVDPGAALIDELSWTPVGPGARRGLNRLSGRPVRFQQPARKFLAEILELMPLINLNFEHYFQETLSAHDLQFCLCEFDKYERVRLNEGRPRSLYQHKLKVEE